MLELIHRLDDFGDATVSISAESNPAVISIELVCACKKSITEYRLPFALMAQVSEIDIIDALFGATEDHVESCELKNA